MHLAIGIGIGVALAVRRSGLAFAALVALVAAATWGVVIMVATDVGGSTAVAGTGLANVTDSAD